MEARAWERTRLKIASRVIKITFPKTPEPQQAPAVILLCSAKSGGASLMEET
jgi:hypothetical protein